MGVAWCETILPWFLRLFSLAPVPLVRLGATLELVGGLLVLVATLRLERSFGIVAANRGIQISSVRITSTLIRLRPCPRWLAKPPTCQDTIIVHVAALVPLSLPIGQYAGNSLLPSALASLR